ncbi:uncharacterized protein LOC122248480 [Penaeus japonicus]|uniref:uncharacterized protein LOC122248480 n=1 Tax=Penaeus japonicus TaxID=27405 RepID=UPI001C717B0F|nr:uncharacterized protein LOC122248480 [Penaeus japonicus]
MRIKFICPGRRGRHLEKLCGETIPQQEPKRTNHDLREKMHSTTPRERKRARRARAMNSGLGVQALPWDEGPRERNLQPARNGDAAAVNKDFYYTSSTLIRPSSPQFYFKFSASAAGLLCNEASPPVLTRESVPTGLDRT